MTYNSKPFRVGTILKEKNYLEIKDSRPIKKEITIKFPSRLNAMAINPRGITNNSDVCKAGEVVFSIPIFRIVKVKIVEGEGKIKLAKETTRSSLIMHAALLMKKALGFKDSIEIDVDTEYEIKHCGLGSSSAIISAVGIAINELYGKPYKDEILIRYLAQNHGEEIENEPNFLVPVQCIGGSAASGITLGGLHIITGESTVITSMVLDDDYKVVIAVPKEYKEIDAKEAMDEEIKSFHKFEKTAQKYSQEIAFRMLHDCIPELKNNNLKPLGDLIFDYRYDMGSIENCSFNYPPIVDMAKKVKCLKINGLCDVLSMSSVGPAMFAITKYPDECTKIFEQTDFKTIMTSIYNKKYEVL